MTNNPFIESLELPQDHFSHPPLAYVSTEYISYHGSPFSPEDMNIVFRRNGFGDSWAILPQQAYHINEEGTGIEPFSDGPVVSAGRWQDARSRAFLNKHASQFIELEHDAGFSSAGVLDAMDRPVTVIPNAVAQRLAKHQPDGYIYSVDIMQQGFAPANFSEYEDRARDRYEHRSPYMVHPADHYKMSFAEFAVGHATLVIDGTIQDVKRVEQDIRERANANDRSIQGAEAVREHFVTHGIAVRALSEM